MAEKTAGHLYTTDLDQFLAHVTHNFEHPFTGHDLAEWKRAQSTASPRPLGPIP